MAKKKESPNARKRGRAVEPQARLHDDPRTVSGKRVVLSGGSTGIGKATVRLLVMRGARVLFFGNDPRTVKAALAELEPFGEVHGLVADQSRPQDVKRVFREADKRLGGLDVLVNNAAIATTTITKGDYEDWKKLVDVNVMGYLACAREALDRMQRNTGTQIGGHIVNIGSMSADLREEGGDLYVASKAAIQGFSESLRKLVNRKGVKVTLIEPGLVGTPLTSVPREKQRQREESLSILKPEDIAECVHYCLVQPKRCDVVLVQIRPHMQII